MIKNYTLYAILITIWLFCSCKSMQTIPLEDMDFVLKESTDSVDRYFDANVIQLYQNILDATIKSSHISVQSSKIVNRNISITHHIKLPKKLPYLKSKNMVIDISISKDSQTIHIYNKKGFHIYELYRFDNYPKNFYDKYIANSCE